MIEHGQITASPLIDMGVKADPESQTAWLKFTQANGTEIIIPLGAAGLVELRDLINEVLRDCPEAEHWQPKTSGIA